MPEKSSRINFTVKIRNKFEKFKINTESEKLNTTLN